MEHEGEFTEHPNNGETLPVVAIPTTMQAMERADIDVQISTAKQYPMHTTPADIERFRNLAISLSTADKATAAECSFALCVSNNPPKKYVNGPSIRQAEILAATWGNLRIGGRVIEVTDTEVIAQGVCHDLENNVVITKQCARSILRRNGTRYPERLVTLHGGVATSIAVRNAILAAIPKPYWQPVYGAVQNLITGGDVEMPVRVAKMLKAFGQMKIEEDRILAAIGRYSTTDITPDDLVTLVGLHTAIQEGSTTPNEAFPTAKPEVDAANPPQGSGSVRKPRAVTEPPKAEETPAMPEAKPLDDSALDAENKEFMDGLNGTKEEE